MRLKTGINPSVQWKQMSVQQLCRRPSKRSVWIRSGHHWALSRMSSEGGKQILSTERKQKVASGKRAYNYALTKSNPTSGKMSKSGGHFRGNRLKMKQIKKGWFRQLKEEPTWPDTRNALFCVVTSEPWHERDALTTRSLAQQWVKIVSVIIIKLLSNWYSTFRINL